MLPLISFNGRIILLHARTKGKNLHIDIVINVRCNKWFPAKEEVTQEIFRVHVLSPDKFHY